MLWRGLKQEASYKAEDGPKPDVSDTKEFLIEFINKNPSALHYLTRTTCEVIRRNDETQEIILKGINY